MRRPERLPDRPGDLLQPAQRRRAERLAQGHDAEPDRPRRPATRSRPATAPYRGRPRGPVAVGRRAAVADPRLGVLARGPGARAGPPSRPGRRRRARRRRARATARRGAPPSCPAAAPRRRAPARAPTPSTSSRTIASPARPPSRYSYDGIPGVRGVMTNGGLLTTRSNRSSATGSSIDPCAQLDAPHRPGERRVEPGERERPPRDVGADHPARVPRRVQRLDPAAGAEVEHAVALGSRTVTCASVVDAPPTPSTWSVRSACPVASSPRSDAIHQSTSPPPSTAVYGRRSTRARTCRRPVRPRPGRAARRRRTVSVGSARSSIRRGGGGAEQERCRTSAATASSAAACRRAQRRHAAPRGAARPRRPAPAPPRRRRRRTRQPRGRRAARRRARDRSGAHRARCREPPRHHPRHDVRAIRSPGRSAPSDAASLTRGTSEHLVAGALASSDARRSDGSEELEVHDERAVVAPALGGLAGRDPGGARLRSGATQDRVDALPRLDRGERRVARRVDVDQHGR